MQRLNQYYILNMSYKFILNIEFSSSLNYIYKKVKSIRIIYNKKNPYNMGCKIIVKIKYPSFLNMHTPHCNVRERPW